MRLRVVWLFQTHLASVHALVRDESLSLMLEPVWLRYLLESRFVVCGARNAYVAEGDPGERSACNQFR